MFTAKTVDPRAPVLVEIEWFARPLGRLGTCKQLEDAVASGRVLVKDFHHLFTSAYLLDYEKIILDHVLAVSRKNDPAAFASATAALAFELDPFCKHSAKIASILNIVDPGARERAAASEPIAVSTFVGATPEVRTLVLSLQQIYNDNLLYHLKSILGDGLYQEVNKIRLATPSPRYLDVKSAIVAETRTSVVPRLLQRIVTIRRKAGERLKTYVTRFQLLDSELKAAGVTIPDNDLSAMLLAQVPPVERRALAVPPEHKRLTYAIDNLVTSMAAIDLDGLPSYRPGSASTFVKNLYDAAPIDPSPSEKPSTRGKLKTKSTADEKKTSGDGDTNKSTNVVEEEKGGEKPELRRSKRDGRKISLRTKLRERKRLGHCLRCGGTHKREDCNLPRQSWEDDYDRNPENFISEKRKQAPGAGEVLPENHSMSIAAVASTIKVTAQVNGEDTLVACDTMSDFSIANKSALKNLREVPSQSFSHAGGYGELPQEIGDCVVSTPHGVATVTAYAKESDPANGCKLLLGANTLRALDIDANALLDSEQGDQVKFRKRPAMPKPEMHLGERDLSEWLKANKEYKTVKKSASYLDVDINPKLSMAKRSQLSKLLQKHRRVFQYNGALPKSVGEPIEFEIKGKPIHAKEPNWAKQPAKATIVRQWAQKGLESGLLSPSSSKWASNLLLVPKQKKGQHKSAPIAEQKLRDAFDLARVNTVFPKIPPNNPNGMEQAEASVDFDYYLSTNGCDQYNSLPLKDGSTKESLAVHTPDGLVHPNRLVFGQRNAAYYAMKYYREAFRHMSHGARQRLKYYMDDLMVMEHDWDKFIAFVDEFFTACGKTDITLNAHKTTIGYDMVEFFGFYVGKSGMSISDKALDPIRQMEPPINVPELRSVLGQLVQHKKWVENYSAKLKPLTNLLKVE